MPPRSLPVKISSFDQRWVWAFVAFAAGGHFATSTLQTWLDQPDLAISLLSPDSYHALMTVWNVPSEQVGNRVLYSVPWSIPATFVLSLLTLATTAGAVQIWITHVAENRWPALARWITALGLGALGIGLWEWIWIGLLIVLGETGATLMAAVIPFWIAVAGAGTLTWGIPPREMEPAEIDPGSMDRRRDASFRWTLWSFIGLYTLVFTTMNWRLWFNLLLPHGDSAMYEEHLWNVLHGKGFRSYLDQGLFLGEHLQVVHLALLPLYLLWPSHLLLELCESLALGCGAFPVAWMTQRHTGSRRLALAAAAAYLLYTPMQFLDIEIDLKTFRPEAFGIPILLLTLDQLERGHWRGFLVGAVCCLTVKEDYAIILSPLGLWVAAHACRLREGDIPRLNDRKWLWTGLILALGGVIYLWLATRVIMPWFRTGAEIHYASYFTRLGDSPEAIVQTLLTRPLYVAGLLWSLPTLLYAMALLVPVGGLALCSPGRLAVGLPLWGILCLNELARDTRHQFHAPLVAIVFWATAAGLSHWPRLWQWYRQWRNPNSIPPKDHRESITPRLARWLWTSSLMTGLFFSLSPLGITFWDPGSSWYWQKLYGPSPRGAEFAKVIAEIPKTARVASTDFIHPRFTHFERSYDYSDYARKVSGYERRVPDDTDYIVIDTNHPYSRIEGPEDIPEYHDQERWELLPDRTNGMFLVLKKRTGTATRQSDSQ